MDESSRQAALQVGSRVLTVASILVVLFAGFPAALYVGWYDFGRSPDQRAMDTAAYLAVLGYSVASLGLLTYSLLGARRLAAFRLFVLLTVALAIFIVLKVTLYG
jgi:hypothetical protein